MILFHLRHRQESVIHHLLQRQTAFFNSFPQTPPITSNDTPRRIPILHQINIRLRNFLRIPYLPQQHSLPHHLSPHLPLLQRAPHLRNRWPRTNTIDTSRRQLNRQRPRNPIQRRPIHTLHRPALQRPLRDLSAGEGERGFVSGIQEPRCQFADYHRYHAGEMS